MWIGGYAPGTYLLQYLGDRKEEGIRIQAATA